MSTGTANQRLDIELQRIEKRIAELVTICDELKEENRYLKQRQDILMSERANLLQKNEVVRGKVESMIERLKAMEHTS